MKKQTIRSIIHAVIPLTLLIAFALALYFPEAFNPFMRLQYKSSPGLGSQTIIVPAAAEDGSKKKSKGDVSVVFKLVPAGTAPRGCTDVSDGTVVTEEFVLGETEVTRGLWRAVTSAPSLASYRFSGLVLCDGDAKLPVVKVSWRDAIVFCNALSELMGNQPVYYQEGEYVTPVRDSHYLETRNDALFVRPGSDGFRLPTSMEWELAARYLDGVEWTPGSNPSGSSVPYYEYSRSDLYAVYNAPTIAPVRSLVSNQLGIYDMSGNAWEWCYDLFVKDSTAIVDDESRIKRIVRGGSWMGNAYRLQVGGEFGSLPGITEIGQGFRLARSRW